MHLSVKASANPCKRRLSIPRLGEALVLLVKLDKMHVVVAHDVAAPLLDGQRNRYASTKDRDALLRPSQARSKSPGRA